MEGIPFKQCRSKQDTKCWSRPYPPLSLNGDKAVPPSQNEPEYSFLHPRMNLNNPCHLARMHPSTFPHLFLKCTWVYVLTATTLLANQILLQHPHPWFRQLNNSFCIIQEVHLINSTIVPLLPIVPNPYTILSTIPRTTA